MSNLSAPIKLPVIQTKIIHAGGDEALKEIERYLTLFQSVIYEHDKKIRLAINSKKDA